MDEAPEKIPEESASNNGSDRNEDGCPSIQAQQLQFQPRQHPNPMPPSWPMPFPAGSPMMNPQANMQASPPMLAGPVNANPALLQYYEAQMRDHAAAYASAAAAAAITAHQIAQDIASSNQNYQQQQQQINAQQMNAQQQQNIVPMSPMNFPDSPMYQPPNMMNQNFGPPHYQQQQWMEMPSQQAPANYGHQYSAGNQNTNYHHRRRKRQQRVHNRELASNEAPVFGFENGTTPSRSQQGQLKRGRRRPRFWNDAGSSDSGDPSYSQGNNNSEERNSRNYRRNRKMAKAASSSSDGGSASWITKKKQRQPNDDSLLGKTGISALYEWCTKRRTTPTFSMVQSPHYNSKKDTNSVDSESQQDDSESQQPRTPKDEEGKRRRLELEDDFFEITVSIDGNEMATGRGRTKTAAKHDASRRLLLTLLPGVEFDDESGILTRLPGNSSQRTPHGTMQEKMAAITSLEDLAPNLAKHLAIGHSNDDETNQRKKKPSDSRKRQKWPQVYPGTSTTSDDEDDDSYYASRGAYVCISLLHTMVQIDDRLTEPPEFTYQVSAITTEPGAQHLKLKRKAGVPINSTSTAFPRGTFQCFGTLKLRIDPATNGDDSFDEAPLPRDCYRLLRASGVGGTKREARYITAAKLLAMLFPECDGMADVKQAAEAAKERHATSRALKLRSKRQAQFTAWCRSKNVSAVIRSKDSIPQNLMFGRVNSNIPAVPTTIKDDFLKVLGDFSLQNVQSEDSSGDKSNDIIIESQVEAGLVRQLSRQQQLEGKMDLALQKLNEHDDEGRSLPEQLTADDVGRTMLRRAGPDDMFWVEKLFRTKSAPQSDFDSSPLFETMYVTDEEPSSRSMRMWSSSTIVLLLCRAIAPHEDPPLGCAVLTVGFSLQKGKTLRIAQIARKSHQPKERFIETLSLFAKNMGCSLITTPPKSSFDTLEKDHIVRRLLDPQIDSNKSTLRIDGSKQSTASCENVEPPTPREGSRVKSFLQAVEEEGEGADESDSSSPNDEKDKRREKPSKRSRFQ